jgi:hypothetical protein
MERGHAYLVAVMDWHTRAVLSWKLSNTLDTAFCLEACQVDHRHQANSMGLPVTRIASRQIISA